MRAAGREENASEAPSHSDTFKEAEVASDKSTLPQWVDNVARCDVSREQDTHTEVTLTDIIHRRVRT